MAILAVGVEEEAATVTPDMWVDFNDVTSTGETTTFVDYATPDVPPVPGHIVWLATVKRTTAEPGFFRSARMMKFD